MCACVCVCVCVCYSIFMYNQEIYIIPETQEICIVSDSLVILIKVN